MIRQKIQSFFGYLIAGLMIPLAMITLLGMGPVSEALVKTTGVEISPWFTGGEVKTIIDHGNYQTRIHRPVFDGLLWDRREGFVQIVWTPAGELPETVREEVDYDGDGQFDFIVTLHPQSKTAQWESYQASALNLQGPYQITDGIGVRIGLKKQ